MQNVRMISDQISTLPKRSVIEGNIVEYSPRSVLIDNLKEIDVALSNQEV